MEERRRKVGREHGGKEEEEEEGEANSNDLIRLHIFIAGFFINERNSGNS